MMNKQAEMGVGTLIVFIAMLLVAAVAAGVLIQTAGSLQEKSLSTGQQARAQISTNARVIEVSGSDGRNGNLTDFQQIVKLSPGSDAIKLDQIIFTFNTKDKTSTLKYKGEDGICDRDVTTGYSTLNTEELGEVGQGANNYTLLNDLDDDWQPDYVYVNNSQYLVVALSSAGNYSFDMGSDLSDASGTPVTINSFTATVSNGTDIFAYITIDGTSDMNDTLVEDMQVEIEPYHSGEGYFVAIYEQTGTNHVPGNLQRGDVIRLCYEAPGQIVEDEQIRLNFIPKIGTPTLTQFVTPDVVSTERVYLYP